MTIDEFYAEIKRVESFYGRDYNDLQKQEMFKYFNNHTVARFKFVISKAYQNFRNLPALSDLIQMHKETPFTATKKKEEAKKEKCKICDGDGFKLYTKKDKNTGIKYVYVAHCECAKSYNFRFDGRKIKDEKCKSDYYIPSYKSIV